MHHEGLCITSSCENKNKQEFLVANERLTWGIAGGKRYIEPVY